MKKSALGAIVVAGAIVGAVSACTPNATSGTATNSPAASLASDVSDLSFHGGADAAMSSPLMTSQPTAYTFRTVDDGADPTFNQLLGINDDGLIAGYFGSGAAGHPNKGYRVANGARSFVGENFPKSVQTQATAVNNTGVTVGFWSAANNANQVNDNTGFVLRHGEFHSVTFPASSKANPPVNQLLGVNDDDIAVGFYTDAAGNNHGYRYNVDRRSFSSITVAGSTSVTAAAINDRDQIAGLDTTSAGATEGFLRGANGSITHLAYPGASMTQAFGLSNRDEVVGVYQVGTGANAATHGFTWTAGGGFKTVDDPNGVGATTVNGINDAGVLVGFYADSAGNTHGMLAKPGAPKTKPSGSPTTTTSVPSVGGTLPVTEHLNLAPMASGTVAVSRTSGDHYRAHVAAYGFTPGSAHQVDIDAPRAYGPVIRFGAVTADAAGVVDATVDSTDSAPVLPAGSQFVIRLGNNTNDLNRNAVTAEVIARSATLPAMANGGTSTLTAIEQNAAGREAGTPSGNATITYDPDAHTLTVTVNATGVTPGHHAAHIHTGTCQAQGAVRYMLMDYTADAKGDIVNQTRTVTGVSAMPVGGSWYLNVHQGDSGSILTSTGQPAPGFRPLLCANG